MNRPLRILRNATLITTSPLWVPIAIVALVTETHFIPHELGLRRRMRQAGRYRHASALVGQSGTLISDSPTFSWGIRRLWWTPDDVLALAPVPPETEEETSRAMRAGLYLWHPFDRWISQRYISPETGTAYLVGVWHAGRNRKKLQQRHPAMKLVGSWSGGEDLENFMRELGDNKNDVAMKPELRPEKTVDRESPPQNPKTRIIQHPRLQKHSPRVRCPASHWLAYLRPSGKTRQLAVPFLAVGGSQLH